MRSPACFQVNGKRLYYQTKCSYTMKLLRSIHLKKFLVLLNMVMWIAASIRICNYDSTKTTKLFQDFENERFAPLAKRAGSSMPLLDIFDCCSVIYVSFLEVSYYTFHFFARQSRKLLLFIDIGKFSGSTFWIAKFASVFTVFRICSVCMALGKVHLCLHNVHYGVEVPYHSSHLMSRI